MNLQNVALSVASAACRLYPLYSGHGRLANHGLLRRIASGSTGTMWTRLQGTGMRLCVPIDDFTGRTIYYFGDLDPKVSYLCRRILRPGDVAVDVGANLGAVSFLMSSIVGQSGRVVAFEPNPRLCALFDESMSMNGIRNIELHRIALGAKAGELELHINDGNCGASTLIGAGAGVRVPVERLDQIVKTEVRLMKIDVEGFEAQMLDGASGLLSTSPPDAILFEINGPDERKQAKEIRSICLLWSAGYELYGVPKSYGRPKLVSVDKNSTPRSFCHDILAVKPTAGISP